MQRRGYSIFKAIDLIFRSLLGTVSEEEQAECDRMSEETGLTGQIPWLSDRKQIRPALQEDTVFDPEEAYRLFLNRVSRRSSRVVLSWLQVAAMWLLPLVAGGLIWYLIPGQGQGHLPVEEIQPVSTSALLTFADGKQVRLTTARKSLAEKEGTLVVQDSGCLIYSNTEKINQPLVYNCLTVPRGGEYLLKLSDGTRIWLNSESELKYPVQFTGNIREVFLKGEGYFSVSHNVDKPFVVSTSLGKVEVLGTEFNVRDYAVENRVVTTLVNGKVKYSDPRIAGRELVLAPGFQVTDQSEKGSLIARKVNLPEYVGWKDGCYIFNNLSLEEMMQTIERNYNVTVFFTNETIKKLRFSGDLKKYDRVEHFLKFIETGGDVTFRVQGRTIIVQPK